MVTANIPTRTSLPHKDFDPDEAFEALEQLPPRLKHFILYDAAVKWSPIMVLEAHREGHHDDFLIRRMRKLEAEDLRQNLNAPIKIQG